MYMTLYNHLPPLPLLSTQVIFVKDGFIFWAMKLSHLTIEPAVGNGSTRYNGCTCVIITSLELNSPYGVTFTRGTQEAPHVSLQLVQVPGADVATVVLEVIAETVVHVPWSAQCLWNSEVHPAVAVFQITPLKITNVS